VKEPYPHGITKAIPYGRRITLTAHAHEPAFTVARDSAPFTVVDRKLGRVALRSAKGFLSVAKDGTVSIQDKTPGDAETFQWIETFTGELTLLSLQTHRYLRVEFGTGALHADSAGPEPDGPKASGSIGRRRGWAAASSAAG